MLGQNRQLPGNQRQFLVARLFKVKADPVLAERFSAVDCAVVVTVKGQALCHQRFKRPDHIISSDRGAVVPARFGTQVEDDPGAVGRPFHGFCDKPISRKRFVSTVDQERFHRAGARGIAFGNKRVKAVKGAVNREPQGAALGCCGVDVVEMRESRCVLGGFVVEHSHGMAGESRVCYQQPCAAQNQHQNPHAKAEIPHKLIIVHAYRLLGGDHRGCRGQPLTEQDAP